MVAALRRTTRKGETMEDNNRTQTQIHWYPGHMAKARRMLQENLKLIDVVVELVDARAPAATRNPDFDGLFQNRTRVVLLNKSDLADPSVTKEWVAHFAGQGVLAEAIAAAVRRDAANGTWGTYEWFDSSDAHDYAINMELTFEYQEQDSSGTSYTSTDWITIRVRPEMTETEDCLLRLGLVTKADLVTRAELYPEDYGYDAVQGEGDGAVLADENTSVAVVG